MTAWRGVTGPGVPPLEAAWEALVLPADRCGGRFLAGRTRPAAALSEEHRCYAIGDRKPVEQRDVLILLAQLGRVVRPQRGERIRGKAVVRTRHR
ncbi:MAG: hypothetical protein WBP81_21195 [Solirubrobacteraceae bacterium]